MEWKNDSNLSFNRMKNEKKNQNDIECNILNGTRCTSDTCQKSKHLNVCFIVMK